MKLDFVGGGREAEAERERFERDEIWVGILTLLGLKRVEEILGGIRKWVGRIVERESEMEAMGRGGHGTSCWSS